MSDAPSLVLLCESREADLSAPRHCRLLAPVRADDRDDYWLAEVDPPFIGQHFGLGAEDISEIIIATRLEGQSLQRLKDEITPVYVARVLSEEVRRTKRMRAGQTELILWGEVKRSRVRL